MVKRREGREVPNFFFNVYADAGKPEESRFAQGMEGRRPLKRE